MTVPPVPILLYHKVGCPVRQPCDTFLNISAEGFAGQMRLLASLGFRTRPASEVLDALEKRRSLPRRTVAITFDDAYSCVGEAAAPVLRGLGFTACVFVVSRCVGKANSWDTHRGTSGLPLLSWADLRRLLAAGWEVGGHTRTHPHLHMLGERAAYEEIAEGKSEIEAELGVRLSVFCYPYGSFNSQTPSLVRAAGFRGACTTRSGLARARYDPFLQPRVKARARGAIDLLYGILLRPYLPGFPRPRAVPGPVSA